MKTLLKYMMLLSIIGLLVTGCSNKEDDTVLAVQDLVVSDDFNWQASRQVELQLEVLNNHNNPVENIVFEIYNGDPSQAGEVIAKGVTEANGKFESFVNVPSSLTKIWAVGYMSTMELSIQNNRVAYTYGGAVAASKGGTDFAAPKSKAWAYLPGMTFNSQGVPAPMTSVALEPDFLTRVNTTLPERYSVPQYHPHYLNPQNQTNIKIDEPAEVWITFVHEGAGNKNALGFHTYPSATVPQTTNDVGIKTILLPNASLVGSSGGMQAGDTMYLGIFNPGTTLGWFLVANGFQSGANVSTTAPIYYSNTHLNPEPAADDKQHSILVYDSISERLLIGFEDLNRTTGSDEDFNDLVFFVTVNPIEAVDMDGVPPMDEPGDRDNDGISDLFDDYPDDPELAFDNYTYGENGWGSLAYEDLWPAMGDYDFNDMVLDYNYNQITRAGNLVKKVEMKFKLRAVGASKSNGFAVQLPFMDSNIYSIVPSHPAFFERETSSSKAVLRFFNSTFDLIPRPGDSYINTQPGSAFQQPVEFNVSFKLTNPVSVINVAPTAPYNPFIFVDGVRSHEVHLAGYEPTPLMNTALFGTGNDASSTNNWYKTTTNLPWAIDIPASWDYPVEKAEVTKAYLKFQIWAQSSGASYPNWYQNISGYRNPDFIYQTP